ncbi:uncharacterized protein LOC115876048 [Sitophilus oryzae]|uniref:Uncharacterized protein LOC115876048 n=1 Tax=Sitophilus oryzae TaxID=7048 RepID=A0A6J2X8N6_SITOR|nr:uncharacterized protein LOC115876048 [Sitophilus oryzae]
MSLSQKHSGLILVPWFNKMEWDHVYNLVYSENKAKQSEALNILKMWKARTPILPAGVEGTLIILEALLIDDQLLTYEQFTKLYSVALMRFLNLSAANSDKQGTFSRTSSKNELPKWLVNLRHDIAHGHQIPSKFNLQTGLNFGFKWLKEKYWRSQENKLIDFYGETNEGLVTNVKAYVNLNMLLFKSSELDESYVDQIKQKFYKKYKKKINYPSEILEILEETIRQSLDADQSEKNVNELLNVLVSIEGLLKTNLDSHTEQGEIKIIKDFRNIWKNIISLLHHFNLLFSLISKLFHEMSDVSNFDNTKKMASIWIRELLISLMYLKYKDSMKENFDYLEIHSNGYLYERELLQFQDKVLVSSNEHSINFIDILLKYNRNTEEFNSTAIDLINFHYLPGSLANVENIIFSVSDLESSNIFDESVDAVEYTESNVSHYSNDNNLHEIKAGAKWTKITDTSAFKNCPVGILPHQIQKRHPFLL